MKHARPHVISGLYWHAYPIFAQEHLIIVILNNCSKISHPLGTRLTTLPVMEGLDN